MHRSLDSRSCKIKSVYLSTVKHCYKTSVLNRVSPVATDGRLILILNLHSSYYFFISLPSWVRLGISQVLRDPSWVKRMTTGLTNKSFAYTNFAVCECFIFFILFCFFFYSTQKFHCNIKWVSKILLFFMFLSHRSDLLQN